MVRQSILLTVLALCVVSSKHILIYNEELLVLLSFVAFVVFCSHTMSETVHSTFQARSAAIEQELQAYLKLQVRAPPSTAPPSVAAPAYSNRL